MVKIHSKYSAFVNPVLDTIAVRLLNTKRSTDKKWSAIQWQVLCSICQIPYILAYYGGITLPMDQWYGEKVYVSWRQEIQRALKARKNLHPQGTSCTK